MLAWSVIGRLTVCTSCLSFALTMLTIHLLTASHQIAPASAADWFNKGFVMCYHVYVIMHVKDPELSVIRVGHCVQLICLCPYKACMCWTGTLIWYKQTKSTSNWYIQSSLWFWKWPSVAKQKWNLTQKVEEVSGWTVSCIPVGDVHMQRTLLNCLQRKQWKEIKESTFTCI